MTADKYTRPVLVGALFGGGVGLILWFGAVFWGTVCIVAAAWIWSARDR